MEEKKKKRRKSLGEYAVEHNMEYLLEEWDEEKNELTVDEVAAGDKNKYHWKKHKCKELGIKLYRIRENLTSLNDYSIDILCNEKHDSLNQVIQKLITNIFNIYQNGKRALQLNILFSRR